MQFQNEKQRQDYYKKLHLKNLNIEEENSDKISSAYHDISFGEVPAVSDNRSIAEREKDDRFQQEQAQKNCLTLMANDGHETNVLLAKITSSGYVEFNKHFLDIFNGLKGQIGKIKAVEAFAYIDRYILKYDKIKGVDIPTQQALETLMAKIDEKFDGANAAVADVLLRLAALKASLNNNGGGYDDESTSSNSNSTSSNYEASSLPSGSDIQSIHDSLDNDGSDISVIINALSTVTSENLDDVVADDWDTDWNAENEGDSYDESYTIPRGNDESQDIIRYNDESKVSLDDLRYDESAGKDDTLYSLENVPEDDETAISMKSTFSRYKKNIENMTSEKPAEIFGKHYQNIIRAYENESAYYEVRLQDVREDFNFIFNAVGVNLKKGQFSWLKHYKKLFDDNILKIEQFKSFLESYKDGPEGLISSNVTNAIKMFPERLAAYEGSDDDNLKYYVRAMNALNSTLRFEDQGKRVSDDELIDYYRVVSDLTLGKDLQNGRPKISTIKANIQQEPYISLFKWVKANYNIGSEQPSPEPQAEVRPNIHTLRDTEKNAEDVESFKGLLQFPQVEDRLNSYEDFTRDEAASEYINATDRLRKLDPNSATILRDNDDITEFSDLEDYEFILYIAESKQRGAFATEEQVRALIEQTKYTDVYDYLNNPSRVYEAPDSSTTKTGSGFRRHDKTRARKRR
jgi:hypothetical protein